MDLNELLDQYSVVWGHDFYCTPGRKAEIAAVLSGFELAHADFVYLAPKRIYVAPSQMALKEVGVRLGEFFYAAQRRENHELFTVPFNSEYSEKPVARRQHFTWD